MTDRDTPDHDGITAAVEETIRDHGPVLNIVSRPPGVCPECALPGPTAIHATVLVWLRCAHHVALPPLPGPRAPRHHDAPAAPGMSHLV